MREVDAALDPAAREARARLLEAERYAPAARTPGAPRLIRDAVAALAHAAADHAAELRPVDADRLDELAHLVADGVPLDEAARRAGVALEAARDYLRSIRQERTA